MTLPNWLRTAAAAARREKIKLPRRILLVRHGNSLGNVDEEVYTRIPDWKIPLSPLGQEQAREAGDRIQEAAGDGPLFFYVSPYLRTKETLAAASSAISSPVLFVREEPRLREQDFGNFQDLDKVQRAKQQRREFGRFFYRFEQGESGADVYDRVSSFCGTFYRDVQALQREDATACIVTHGITARLFLMRWLHWQVDEFEHLHNPPNCGVLEMQRSECGTQYELSEESRALIRAPKCRAPEESSGLHASSYKFKSGFVDVN